MSILIDMLPHLPDFPREEILAELFRATADGFRHPVPAVDHLSCDERLRAYALFTRDQAESVLRSGRNIAAIKTRLYRKSYPLGAKAREWLGVETMEEVIELGLILYQAIGVEIEGETRCSAAGYPCGILTVKRCYFSQFYTSPVCDLISALDDGILSGLSGGGRLTFSERITEGKPCCRAVLSPREEGIR